MKIKYYVPWNKYKLFHPVQTKYYASWKMYHLFRKKNDEIQCVSYNEYKVLYIF